MTRHLRPCPRMTSHEHRPTACHLKKEKATGRLRTRVQLTTNVSYSFLKMLYFLMVLEGRNMKFHKTKACFELVQTLSSSSTQPEWELYPWTFISANHHWLNCSVEKVAFYSNLLPHFVCSNHFYLDYHGCTRNQWGSISKSLKISNALIVNECIYTIWLIVE